ncbi:unnamed protein product [Blepharisma stoltei]|uniref:Transmembrane protein n=1 Tax=Blepharisma stoltei TaxID=1481888 RepID=A0AAU9IX61_9CILI|nr:unnamed protein product [Blepharisma stoltei]
MEPEDFIKLRLEYLSKKKLILHISLFLCVFLGCAIASTSTPQMIYYSSVIVDDCEPGNNDPNCFNYTGNVQTWSGVISGVSTYNQVLFLTATPETKENVEFDLDLRVILKGKNWKKSAQYPVIDSRSVKTIDCLQGECNSLMIFYEPYLNYKIYNVSIEVYSPIAAEDIKFDLGYISPKFTRFQLMIKSWFLAFSLSSLVYFLLQTSKIPSYLWNFDAKMVAILGLSLVLFNEPLLLFSIDYPHHIWSFISVFCATQFVGCLLYFWMAEFQSYKQFKNQWIYFIAEAILVGAFFILLFIVYCYVHLQLKYDPSYDWQNDFKTSYRNAFIAAIAFLSIIGIWILYLCIRAIPAIRKFTARKRFIIKLNFCMMVISFFGVGIGAFQSIPRNGELMLVYVAALNLYVVLLEWLYTPERRSIEEFNKTQEYDYAQLSHPKREIEMTENTFGESKDKN